MPALYATFLRDYDWNPSHYRGVVTTLFKARNTYLLTREANEAALAAGAARKATKQETENARRRRTE